MSNEPLFKKENFTSEFTTEVLKHFYGSSSKLESTLVYEITKRIRMRMIDMEINSEELNAFPLFILRSLEVESDLRGGEKLFLDDCMWRYFAEGFLNSVHKDMNVIAFRKSVLERTVSDEMLDKKFYEFTGINSSGVKSYYLNSLSHEHINLIPTDMTVSQALLYGNEYEMLCQRGLGVKTINELRERILTLLAFPMPFIIEAQPVKEVAKTLIADKAIMPSKLHTKFLEGIISTEV